MGNGSQNEIIKFYKKRIEPFVAIFVLVFLITACFLVWQDNQLKKEIGENCGYENKNYICYCEKKVIDEVREQMNNQYVSGGVLNVSLGR